MTALGVTALTYFTETRVSLLVVLQLPTSNRTFSGASDDTFDGPSDFPPETGP
jgi:hypothetical protein